MDFAPSPRAAELTARVREFVDTRIRPAEQVVTADLIRRRAAGEDPWQPHPVIAELQAVARAQGLWNLFLPAGHEGPYAARYGTDGGTGLSNLDYAPVAEEMGRSPLAPLVFNCNAPDTGNMEVLLKYGSAQQRDRWLDPLLDARIRSAFLMTEPGVASSDATTMEATARVDGDQVVLDGRKWWSTGVGHPDCAVGIFMGLTDSTAPKHRQHSMVLVPLDAPGVEIVRCMPALGQWDEPLGHGEVSLTDVRVPLDQVIAGPGRAFEIAQGRLGPGRIHHCMRAIGAAERALEATCRRALGRTAFGRPLAEQGVWRERIAEARMKIDQARLLVLQAAWMMDNVGNKAAQKEIAMIKVVAPNVACEVLDMAIQLFGGAGVSDDFGLGWMYANARTLRIADGPDEVHRSHIAKLELARHATG